MELKLESKEKLYTKLKSFEGLPMMEVRIHKEPHAFTKALVCSSKGRDAVLLLELQAAKTYGQRPAGPNIVATSTALALALALILGLALLLPLPLLHCHCHCYCYCCYLCCFAVPLFCADMHI